MSMMTIQQVIQGFRDFPSYKSLFVFARVVDLSGITFTWMTPGQHYAHIVEDRGYLLRLLGGKHCDAVLNVSRSDDTTPMAGTGEAIIRSNARVFTEQSFAPQYYLGLLIGSQLGTSGWRVATVQFDQNTGKMDLYLGGLMGWIKEVFMRYVVADNVYADRHTVDRRTEEEKAISQGFVMERMWREALEHASQGGHQFVVRKVAQRAIAGGEPAKWFLDGVETELVTEHWSVSDHIRVAGGADDRDGLGVRECEIQGFRLRCQWSVPIIMMFLNRVMWAAIQQLESRCTAYAIDSPKRMLDAFKDDAEKALASRDRFLRDIVFDQPRDSIRAMHLVKAAAAYMDCVDDLLRDASQIPNNFATCIECAIDCASLNSSGTHTACCKVSQILIDEYLS